MIIILNLVTVLFGGNHLSYRFLMPNIFVLCLILYMKVLAFTTVCKLSPISIPVVRSSLHQIKGLCTCTENGLFFTKIDLTNWRDSAVIEKKEP